MAKSCTVNGTAEPTKEVAPILVFCLKATGQDANNGYSPLYTVMSRTAETYWEPWIPGMFPKAVAEESLKKMLSKRAFERDYLGVLV